MEKLPKEFKEKWIAALRSGEYKQGKGCLDDSDGRYCCLGVACKIAYAKTLDMHEDGYSVPMEWIPEDEENVPMILRGHRDLPSTLADLNDSRRPFSEIADWIEQNL